MLTLIGAALLGLGSALIIQLVPAALGARHPRFTTAVLGEANAVSSFASLLAPAAVAGAIALGVGWAAGYLLPVLPVAVTLLLVLVLQRRDWEQASDAAGQRAEPSPGIGLEAGRLLPRWIVLVLAISVEFCLVFWAATAFTEWHGADPPPLRRSRRRSCSAWLWSGPRPPDSLLGGTRSLSSSRPAVWP